MFQAIKISRLAVNVFEEEGQINISGQGVLRKMFLSAYLSDDKSQLEPPREHYYFNRNGHIGIDSRLVRKVATYFMLTDQEAEIQVHLWETKFIEKVRISDQRFGHFGTFHFNDQLDFVSESLYFYEWLPALPYYLEGTIPHEKLNSENTQYERSLNGQPRRKRKVLLPALWSALAGLFVFALFFWSKPLNLLIDRNVELSTRLVNVAPESYSKNEIPDYFSDTHEVESTTENGEIIVMDTPDINTSSPNNTSPTISDRPSITIPTEDEDLRPHDANAPDLGEKEKLKKNPNELPIETIQRCTLILGAFANPANVDRMKSRLEVYNVEVVTMKRKSLTLVGAQVTCSDNTQINILKNQIEPNAWIYTQ